MPCSGPNGARPAGCALRQPAILVPGVNRPCLAARQWDADALRDVVRDYAVEVLAEPDAVLVVDETGFLKQGKASCGAGRQYTGSAGKITNCQIGRVRGLRVGQGPRLHRPRALPAQGLDRRPGPPGCCACARQPRPSPPSPSSRER